jgi:anaerobic magnesium-protoporphyrin IX monomethyl ester cyclase
MKVVCVVPPLHFPVNEIGHGYQPPLGLLSVAGPIVDAGFDVELVDADAAHFSNQEVISHLRTLQAQVVLVGHSGSMAANPAALRLIADIKAALPEVTTVYGGVYPTYAWREIMSMEPSVDFIVLGEGEETALALLMTLQGKSNDLDSVKGLVWRSNGEVVINRPRRPIPDLDQFRVAWELADWSLYPGRHLPGRSAIVQFSRGCPNTCTYCGQWMFWKRWRHRSIARFVDELQYLREKHDVRTVWIADENWGCDRDQFHALLEAIDARKIGMSIFCALCAEDVVRDADWIDLYQRAGIVCLMMGVESFDDAVLGRVGKNNPHCLTTQAVDILRRHGILSVVNVIYGLREETWSSLLKTLWQLYRMSPDFYNALHLTPLSWTKEGRGIDPARIIQADQSKWNFRQPVIQR